MSRNPLRPAARVVFALTAGCLLLASPASAQTGPSRSATLGASVRVLPAFSPSRPSFELLVPPRSGTVRPGAWVVVPPRPSGDAGEEALVRRGPGGVVIPVARDVEVRRDARGAPRSLRYVVAVLY